MDLRLESGLAAVYPCRNQNPFGRRNVARWIAKSVGTRSQHRRKNPHLAFNGGARRRFGEYRLAWGRAALGGARGSLGTRNCRQSNENSAKLRGADRGK